MRPIYLLSATSKEGALHLPMIQFCLKHQKIDFDRYDGIIFTSKQGVVALESINPGMWQKLPSAAIGKMTADEIVKHKGRVIYTASKAYGDVLAKELFDKFKSFHWLYPRPKVVVSKVAANLRKNGVKVDEYIVYETTCVSYNKDQAPKNGAVLIFTSPSIVHCFLKNFGWNDSYSAVAIGTKTAAAFPKEISPLPSPSVSIDSAINFAFSI